MVRVLRCYWIQKPDSGLNNRRTKSVAAVSWTAVVLVVSAIPSTGSILQNTHVLNAESVRIYWGWLTLETRFGIGKVYRTNPKQNHFTEAIKPFTELYTSGSPSAACVERKISELLTDLDRNRSHSADSPLSHRPPQLTPSPHRHK